MRGSREEVLELDVEDVMGALTNSFDPTDENGSVGVAEAALLW